jgi:hypothetical protein
MFRGDIEDVGILFFDLGVAPLDALENTAEGRALAIAGLWTKLKRTKRFMHPLLTAWMGGLHAAVRSFRPDGVVLFTQPAFFGGAVLERAAPNATVVWCHVVPFAPTVEHAPPIGFGDGATFFEWTARLKCASSSERSGMPQGRSARSRFTPAPPSPPSLLRAARQVASGVAGLRARVQGCGRRVAGSRGAQSERGKPVRCPGAAAVDHGLLTWYVGARVGERSNFQDLSSSLA